MPEAETQVFSRIIKIVLYAAQTLIRESLQVLLESRDNLQVVACTGDNSVLQRLVEENQPDSVLLYVLSDDAESVEKIPKLQKSISEPYILVITKNSDIFSQNRAVQLGAIRTIGTESKAGDLLEIINQICSGKVLPELRPTPLQKNKLWQQEKQFENSVDHNEYKIKTLTEREREIAEMVGEGLRSKEIAAKLNISKATVRHHLSSVYDKLELKDKLNLVIFAHRHKLVKPFNINK